MKEILGFFTPAVVYLYIFLLNLALPGRWVTGYVTKTGTTEKLKYRLNGLPVLFTVIASWIALCASGILAWEWFYEIRWYSLSGAIVFGLVFSFAMTANEH